MFAQSISRIASALPSICAVCGSWPRARVCADCAGRFATVVQRCPCCARLLPLAAGNTVCGQCLHHPLPLARIHAVLPYAYPWNDLIARWKFRSDVGLNRSLAAIVLQDTKARAMVQAAHWVIPMPLFKKRLQTRGYNQSALLAQAICKGLNLPRLNTQLLLRVRDTPEQVGLNRDDRVRNMQGAFALEPALAQQALGQHMVLIDDVMTTGATLLAAAAPLLQAGAASVSALVLAKTDA